MEEKLTKAKYAEIQAYLFGACAVAIGLGALFASYLRALVPVFIIAGVVLHGWGMYKIHQRNK